MKVLQLNSISKKRKVLRKTTRDLPEKRQFLQNLFLSKAAKTSSIGTDREFPGLLKKKCSLIINYNLGDKVWNRMFYREVDTLMSDNGDKLREIEE